MNLIEEQLERFKALEDKGLISPLESKRLGYDLEAAAAEKNLAALEVDMIINDEPELVRDVLAGKS